MKKIILYLSLVLINLTGLALVIFIYFTLISLNVISTPETISKNKLYRKFYSAYFFSKKEKQLLKIMEENYYDFYPALELGGDFEHLSRKLFDFPVYSGQKTFIHKPGIKKLMSIVPIEEKDGIKKINFSLPYDAKLKNLIDDMVKNNTSKDSIKFYRSAAADFDAYGFRKSARGNEKNLPAVLFLGDSYTEGLYVGNDETFAENIGSLMEKENFGYAVNTGCNGYGTINESLIVREFSGKLKVKIAVLMHSFNDILNSQDIVFTGKGAELAKAWDDNFKILKDLHSYCKEKNIILIITAFPNLFQYINLEIESRKNYQDKLKSFCGNNGIVYLDIYDEIKEKLNIDLSKYSGRPDGAVLDENYASYEENSDESIYIPFDDHLTPYGHKIFSEILWNEIKHLNLKP